MGQIYGETIPAGEHTTLDVFAARNGSVELDTVRINQNHPEGEFGTIWERSGSSMVARVQKGAGCIAVRVVVDGKTLHDVMELDEDRGADVPANTWYAWRNYYNEELVAIAAYAPAFDPTTHEVRTEEELRNDESRA